MSIVKTELKLYLPNEISTASTNGGYMTNTLLDTVNVENNLWSNILKEERTSGSITYAKLFCKQENISNEKLYAAQAWLDKQTIGEDYIVLFIGTQSDTQATISPTRFYGVSLLASQASATTTFSVTVEHASMLVGGEHQIFFAGDKIRVSDKADPDESTPGNEEWLTVSTVTNTSGLTMQVVSTGACINTYAIGSKLSSLLPLGDIIASVLSTNITSAAGTYSVSGNIIVDNVATIKDTITCTIKSGGTSFTVNSARLGALPDGTFGVNYTAPNATFSRNYFQINSAGWGGTWLQNDTFVISLNPASGAVWQKRVVPAGCAAQSNNSTIIAYNGQSL